MLAYETGLLFAMAADTEWLTIDLSLSHTYIWHIQNFPRKIKNPWHSAVARWQCNIDFLQICYDYKLSIKYFVRSFVRSNPDLWKGTKLCKNAKKTDRIFINPLLHNDDIWRTGGKSILKTLREKTKMLVTNIFFFFHNVFYPIRDNFNALSNI